MSPAMRRGACPTLPEPMATGDGLLARLALAAPLSPTQLAGLAKLSQCCGNGIVEVSARGSLQVRGLTSASAPAFAEAVGALGIVVREGLAVETNPLAGLDPGAAFDPRPLAEEIARRASPLAGRLAPKVSVIVDGGGALHLDGAHRRYPADGARWRPAGAGSRRRAARCRRAPRGSGGSLPAAGLARRRAGRRRGWRASCPELTTSS